MTDVSDSRLARLRKLVFNQRGAGLPYDAADEIDLILHTEQRRRAVEAGPKWCCWFGEGRGQCLLRDGHKGDHTCEEDGRLLRVAQTGLAAAAERQRQLDCQPASTPAKSVQKRLAAQRGEPYPFDSQESTPAQDVAELVETFRRFDKIQRYEQSQRNDAGRWVSYSEYFSLHSFCKRAIAYLSRERMTEDEKEACRAGEMSLRERAGYGVSAHDLPVGEQLEHCIAILDRLGGK